MSHSKETARAIMKRTLKNLDIVQELYKDAVRNGRDIGEDGPFEVTQLVNSFSGALAHPWELIWGTNRHHIPESAIQLAELIENLNITCGHTSFKARPFGDQLSMIRNAFAHGNIEFPKVGKDIGELRIWNCRPNGPKTWEAVVPIDTLETILRKFVKVADEADALSADRNDCQSPHDQC